MICAIVTAAGRSRRMGTQKLLLPYAGSTVIAHVVDEVLASEVARVLVVVGPDGGAIVEALGERPVGIVTNPESEAEMLSSVRCGLRATPADCRAVLVALGDQPSITTGLVDTVIAAYLGSDKRIAVPVCEGRRGHPLLVSMQYREEVLCEHDAAGLRALLWAHPEDVLEVPVDAGTALDDMDSPEDYARELARLHGRTRASRPVP